MTFRHNRPCADHSPSLDGLYLESLSPLTTIKRTRQLWNQNRLFRVVSATRPEHGMTVTRLDIRRGDRIQIRCSDGILHIMGS